MNSLLDYTISQPESSSAIETIATTTTTTSLLLLETGRHDEPVTMATTSSSIAEHNNSDHSMIKSTLMEAAALNQTNLKSTTTTTITTTETITKGPTAASAARCRRRNIAIAGFRNHLSMINTTSRPSKTTTMTPSSLSDEPLLSGALSTPSYQLSESPDKNNNKSINNSHKTSVSAVIDDTNPTGSIGTTTSTTNTISKPTITNSSNNKNECNEKISSGSASGANVSHSSPHSDQSFGCVHYKRRAMFVTPCCEKFYKCRFCHDENESHHFDRKTLTELICSECHTRQKVQERCENCGIFFGKYTCLICNLFDDTDKQQYHCSQCGICRIGGAKNFFHCAVCDMCLPIRLKIEGHRCVENVSRSHCPVCLGDIHTSRIPCHIPDCGHLLHRMCFDQLLASGHYTCPTCQTSLIDMTALWDYLDVQAELMPIPKKYENQRIHIFCNDCQKTSKTKFHFIGLKCLQCGAYNTTQDMKRRMSLVTDEPTSA